MRLGPSIEISLAPRHIRQLGFGAFPPDPSGELVRTHACASEVNGTDRWCLILNPNVFKNAFDFARIPIAIVLTAISV